MEGLTPDIQTADQWHDYASSPERLWGPPGSEPWVFISWTNRNDSYRALVDELKMYLNNYFKKNNTNYEAIEFTDEKQGTRQGQFVSPWMAERLWKCRGGIFLWCHDFINSIPCHSVELPALLWRMKYEGLPVGRIDLAEATDPALTTMDFAVAGEDIHFRLKELVHDRNFAQNKGGSGAVSFILELNHGDRSTRLDAFARQFTENVLEFARRQSEGRSPKQAVETTSVYNAVEVETGNFSSRDLGTGFIGRVKQREALTDWAERGAAVIALTGIGGEGKTALVLRWIKEDAAYVRARRFEGSFRYSFYPRAEDDQAAPTAENFLAELRMSLGAGEKDRLDDTLKLRCIVILLDGLEMIQNQSTGTIEGTTGTKSVSDLLHSLCSGRAGSSMAILTSRLRVPSFEHYPVGTFINIELKGLARADGCELLRRLHVHEPSDERLRKFSDDLGGHPMMLRVFADAVTRLKDKRPAQSTNAADIVAREMGLNVQGDFNTKLNRVVKYYRSLYEMDERRILEAVAAFGGGASRENVLTCAREMSGTAFDNGRFEERFNALLMAGILHRESKPGARFHTYGCHPIMTEGFRPQGGGFEGAADITLVTAAVPLVPRNEEEARPYLKVIAQLTEGKRFRAAYSRLASNLRLGDVLPRFPGGDRLLLRCVEGFIASSRRDRFRAQVTDDEFGAVVTLAVGAAIDLQEWAAAQEYLGLWVPPNEPQGASEARRSPDAGGTPGNAAAAGPAEADSAQPERPEVVLRRRNTLLRAQVEAELGSPENARRLFETASRQAEASDDAKAKDRPGFTLEYPEVQLKRADFERQCGHPKEALRIIGEWARSAAPAETGPAGWDQALVMLTRLFSRYCRPTAERFHKALSAMPVPAESREEQRIYREYLQLGIVPAEKRDVSDWKRMLDFAQVMEQLAGRHAGLNAGNWPLVRAEALNGLGYFSEAEALAQSIVKQTHPASSWRLWAEVEVVEAWLGQHRQGALQYADTLVGTADCKQRLLLMRRIVSLIAKHANPPRQDEARRELADIDDRMRLGEDDVPDLGGPLPGEPGWDERLAKAATQNADLVKALIGAVRWDDAAAVGRLLACGTLSAPAERARAGEVLLEALRYDRDNLLGLVLEALPSGLDVASQADRLPLLACIAWGNTEALQHLLRYTDAPATGMNELLAVAAQSGSGDAIAALRASGADTAALSGGQHPLVRASRADNLSALIALSDGIDFGHACDEDGETALMAACRNPDNQLAMRWLLNRGVPRDVTDARGRTAKDYLPRDLPYKRLFFAFDLTRLQLESEPMRSTQTFLYDAVRADDIGTVEDILAHPRTDVNQRSVTGMTALHMAVQRGRLDMIDLLLDHPDVDPSIATNDGRTALHIAALKRRGHAYTRLIEDSRSDPSARTKKGQTPLAIARLSGDVAFIRAVRKANQARRPAPRPRRRSE